MEKPKRQVEVTMEYREHRKARVKEIFSDYGAAVGAFAGPAWITDVPIAVVAAVFAFFTTACLASLLFDQLSGIRSLPNKAGSTTGFVRSAIFGAVIAGGSVYAQEYVDSIRLGDAALAGVIVAFTGAAWRQRWIERRLYRDMLLEEDPEPEPGPLPADP